MRSGEQSGKIWRVALGGFIASTAIGLILGAIGPFGSYLNGGFLTRTAYWVVCIWTGAVTIGVSVPVLNHWASRWGIPLWLWGLPAVLILNLFPSLFSRVLAIRIWPEVDTIRLMEWYAQSLLLSALSMAGVLWLVRSAKAKTATSDTLSADPRDRLPAHLGRTVLCLQMEDHYVRVHTPKGSTLVLMSLSQAIAGLKDIEGVQTHRSWWVARAAIAGVIEDGRNLRLALSNGLEAPISRARVGVLRQDGWLIGHS